MQKLFNIWHRLLNIPSEIESRYYSETMLENAKREAIAAKRQQQIEAAKHGKATD